MNNDELRKLKNLKKMINVGLEDAKKGRVIRTDREGMIRIMEAIKSGKTPSRFGDR
jgi:hypothetical protein